MKITKFAHSCLLVEDQDKVTVIDPGVFSVGSGLLESVSLRKLDYVVITHEHADHLDVGLLKEMLSRFPAMQIYTNRSSAVKLQALGYLNVHTEGNSDIQIFSCIHEPNEPLGTTPTNIGVHLFGRLTHPGDSQHFAETRDILALPLTGPWGMLTQAAALGSQLTPKYILPIHDWHWNSAARKEAYNRCEAFFADKGVRFVKLIDGEPVEL